MNCDLIHAYNRVPKRKVYVLLNVRNMNRSPRRTIPVTESREYGNPIHSQNDVHSQNASYCYFESLIFKIKILRSNLNKSPY